MFSLAYSLVSFLAEACPSLFKVYLLQDIAGTSLNPTQYVSLQFVCCIIPFALNRIVESKLGRAPSWKKKPRTVSHFNKCLPDGSAGKSVPLSLTMEFDPWNLPGGRRKATPTSYLTFTYVLWACMYVCPHTK